MHSIVGAPSLKKGNGRELQCLHDVLSRHLCALTTRDPYEPFVTRLIELKLDQANVVLCDVVYLVCVGLIHQATGTLHDLHDMF